ncbi:MAG: hypothetical protein JNJ83_16045 [Verrucomicrobiaceae bacterium]|nr:hypothetical protein [Verrucomicrobiaceae bacterium]
MKNIIRSLALAVISSISLTPVAADAACRSDMIRQAAVLDYKSDAVRREFQQEYGGRRLCGIEADLSRAICSLERLADDLRSSIESGESCSCQERIFRSLKSAHCTVVHLADRARVCRHLRETMRDFGHAVNLMEAIGFAHDIAPTRPHFEPHRPVSRPSHYDRPRTMRPEDLIIGGIIGLLGSR